MRASRILALARTMRCAIVGAGTRKALAMSSVARPHTSRSVSATCASGASAGWQQVKTRRRRSSSSASASARSSQAGAGSAPASHRIARVVPGLEARAAADAVDGLEAPGRHQPGARVGRDAARRPLLERGAKAVVQRLLGQVEVAQQAHQRGEDAARLVAVDRVHRLAHHFERNQWR